MAENRSESRVVPAGHDSNERKRAELSAGKNKPPHTISRRKLLAVGLGAFIGTLGVAGAKEVISKVGDKLEDLQETSEQKMAAIALEEALKRGEDRSVVRNVMADPKSPNKIKFRRRPSTILKDPNGNIALEDPITEFGPGTNFGTGLVVEGMDPEHPKDPRKRSLWVVVKHPETGEPGFIQADYVELGGYPTGAIYNFPPKSLK